MIKISNLKYRRDLIPQLPPMPRWPHPDPLSAGSVSGGGLQEVAPQTSPWEKGSGAFRLVHQMPSMEERASAA